MSPFISKLKPSKIINYLGLKMAYFFEWERVPFLPVTLDIEPNNTCNFRCPHCQVPYWNKESYYLNEENFVKILDQFPNLVSVKLQGMGEPLLNRDLVKLLRIGEGRGIQMNFITNGSICSEQLAEELAHLDNTQITFSLDGASAEVFEKIRAGGRFDRVVENIRLLSRTRGSRKRPKLACWTVVTKHNIHELSRIVRLAKELGLDMMTIQTFLSDWGKESMHEHTAPLRVGPAEVSLSQQIEDASRTAEDLGLELHIASHDYYSKKRKCTWPWTSAFIAANGDVVPCCIVADSDTVKMGNLFDEDFKTIWNSRGYREFRRRIKNHDLPDFCRNCYIDAE